VPPEVDGSSSFLIVIILLLIVGASRLPGRAGWGEGTFRPTMNRGSWPITRVLISSHTAGIPVGADSDIRKNPDR
jgi:hypothetical protein